MNQPQQDIIGYALDKGDIGDFTGNGYSFMGITAGELRQLADYLDEKNKEEEDLRQFESDWVELKRRYENIIHTLSTKSPQEQEKILSTVGQLWV
jgi:hypothetical protein